VSGESIEALFAGLSDGVVLNRLMHCIDHARLYKDDAAYDSVKKGDEGACVCVRVCVCACDCCVNKTTQAFFLSSSGDSKAAWIHKNNVDMYNKCGLRLGLFPQDLVSHDNLIKSDQLENVKMGTVQHVEAYECVCVCVRTLPHMYKNLHHPLLIIMSFVFILLHHYTTALLHTHTQSSRTSTMSRASAPSATHTWPCPKKSEMNSPTKTCGAKCRCVRVCVCVCVCV
jgi:hypothetical protein